MELGTRVAEAVLASAELLEVLCGLWDNVIVEGELDAAVVLCTESVWRGLIAIPNLSNMQTADWRHIARMTLGE